MPTKRNVTRIVTGACISWNRSRKGIPAKTHKVLNATHVKNGKYCGRLASSKIVNIRVDPYHGLFKITDDRGCLYIYAATWDCLPAEKKNVQVD